MLTLTSMTIIGSSPAIDPRFLALPLDGAADAALSSGLGAGASWVEVRIGRIGSSYTALHDAVLEDTTSTDAFSLGVRVLVDGVWGFAADPEISPDGARRAALAAVALARVVAPLSTRRVELGALDTPVTASWSSPFLTDPTTLDPSDVAAVLADWSHRVLRDGAEHVDASFMGDKELKFYADSHGNRHVQQRVRSYAELTGTRPDAAGEPVSLRTLAQPVGRGWEWVVGGADGALYDWAGEIEGFGELLTRKAAAPLVTPGRYDLVIDPTQLWLTIHETIGHATELDRILGYEANYAGTTFVRLEDLGALRYGTPLLNVTADRNTPHGLATVAFDDEGVPTRSFPLISDGVLTGVQADRGAAAMAGLDSTACAYAESGDHVPIQRMPNISMQPQFDGADRDDLVSGVEDGFLVIGDDSWSIDMQRRNFQMGAQQFWRIRHGRIDGMMRNAAYQSTTPEFWGSLRAVGGPDTYVLHGTSYCGKGQPGQAAPVSHGSPAARFDDITVLRTTEVGA